MGSVARVSGRLGAMNDPTTAVQALDAIDDLLRDLARRDLAVETVGDAEGQPRVQLHLLRWEDYVGVAPDEIIAIRSASVQGGRRLTVRAGAPARAT
jgi:uncharacterized membrane protein